MAANRVESLFREHAHQVLAYALRRTDPATAEDVVAEVFATAWRRADRVPDADPVLWLYAVARRVMANQRRSLRRRAAFEASLRPLMSEHAPLDRDDDRLAVAMRALAPADREVLCLSAWEELDAARLAVVLGCSVGAATTRLHRARRRLAAGLEQADDPCPDPLPEAAR